MDKDQTKTIAVIDGKSVFYRGYYAMPNLSNAQGVATGGVYGFLTLAFEVIRKLKPDYIAIAWDKPKTNIRRRLELYPEYKAGRKPAPADFYDQIPILHNILSTLHWPLFEFDDYEADDIMGTLAKMASEHHLETKLITSDLDILQLINDQVEVYILKKGLSNIEQYSPKTFKDKYQINVEQFLDYKALKGDSSDNIPGVAGIGDKTAIDLLQKYKTLDNIYENIELIADKLKDKLVTGKNQAYLSRSLAEIWVDAPVEFALAKMKANNVDFDATLAIFKELQFNSLTRQLSELFKDNTKKSTGVINDIKSLNFTFVRIASESDLAKMQQEVILESDAYIFYRTQPNNPNQLTDLVLFYDDLKKFYIIDLANISKNIFMAYLKKLPSLIGYDLKNFYRIIYLSYGLINFKTKFDILIAEFLINSSLRDQSLSEIIFTELGDTSFDMDSLSGEIDNKLIVQLDNLFKLQMELYTCLTKKINANTKYLKLMNDFDLPVISILAKMEALGIELDKPYMKKLDQDITDSLSICQQNIYGLANSEFNVASPSQLADILFVKLGLPTNNIKKGKSGYSTAASELDKLKSLHPVIDQIQIFRELSKLKNTYIDTLPLLADANNRIHTTYNLTIAQTGRLSSTDPNLQNIPTRTTLGKKIRTAFTAQVGHKLISADYSQFELRLAAVLANDQELIEMFNRGADVHLNTAAEIYGRSPEDVTKQMRSAAKTINFGIIYGMSPHGLSNATGMTMAMAMDFINKYKSIRKPIFDYMDEVIIKTREKGYAETLFGRRRYLPDINSKNFQVRTATERAAINMPIQGTEADIMKLAMIEIDKQLSAMFPKANMLLQVHDSVIISAPNEVADDVSSLVQKVMQEIYSLPVRLDVSVAIGTNWGEL